MARLWCFAVLLFTVCTAYFLISFVFLVLLSHPCTYHLLFADRCRHSQSFPRERYYDPSIRCFHDFDKTLLVSWTKACPAMSIKTTLAGEKKALMHDPKLKCLNASLQILTRNMCGCAPSVVWLLCHTHCGSRGDWQPSLCDRLCMTISRDKVVWGNAMLIAKECSGQLIYK